MMTTPLLNAIKSAQESSLLATTLNAKGIEVIKRAETATKPGRLQYFHEIVTRSSADVPFVFEPVVKKIREEYGSVLLATDVMAWLSNNLLQADCCMWIVISYEVARHKELCRMMQGFVGCGFVIISHDEMEKNHGGNVGHKKMSLKRVFDSVYDYEAFVARVAHLAAPDAQVVADLWVDLSGCGDTITCSVSYCKKYLKGRCSDTFCNDPE